MRGLTQRRSRARYPSRRAACARFRLSAGSPCVRARRQRARCPRSRRVGARRVARARHRRRRRRRLQAPARCHPLHRRRRRRTQHALPPLSPVAAAARGATHARVGAPETPITIPSRRGSDAVHAISEPTSPLERRAPFARLFRLSGWRTPRGATRPADTGAGAGAGGGAATPGGGVPISALAGLRSEEVLGRLAGPASFFSHAERARAGTYDEEDAARLTAAQRAASWGQGDTPEYAELASVQSVDPARCASHRGRRRRIHRRW